MNFVYSIFILFCTSNIFAISHVTPIPYIPESLAPRTSDDIVSQYINKQIHENLFFYSKNNVLSSNIVSHFHVSNTQDYYELTTKNIKFHSGKSFTSKDIKKIIEEILYSERHNFIFLKNIAGAKKFLKNKAKDISGIKIVNKSRISFSLTKPDSKFLHKLTNNRLAISNTKNSKDGLGPYRLETLNNKSIKLLSVKKKKTEINEIEFKLQKKNKAVDSFIKGKVHDLLFYQLTALDRLKIARYAEEVILYSKRTYGIILNSRVMSKPERLRFRSFIDPRLFLNRCVDSSYVYSKSIIPKGFLGFSADPSLVIENKKECPEKSYKLVVPIGLGSEECIARELTKMFKSCKVDVKIKSFGEVIQSWPRNKVSSYVGFIESEGDGYYFDNFKREAKFFIGDHNDTKLDKEIAKFEAAKDLSVKSRLANRINNSIIHSGTVIPLYSKKNELFLSNRYALGGFTVSTVMSIKMADIKVRSKDE